MNANLLTKIPNLAKGMPLKPNPAMMAFSNLVGAWKECNQTAEVEKTKRANVKAWRDVNVKIIEENSEILKKYLELSFKERALTIKETFERLDSALANGNTEMVGLMMNSIVSIVNESPLAKAEQVIASMNNPSINMIEI